MKVLARANKEEKETRHTNKKGRKKVVLVTDDAIFYIENSKGSIPKKLLELINEFGDVAG